MGGMDLQNLILYTDMDGTVLTDWELGPVVPQRSMESIRRFMEKGGTFSIASGRQYSDILPFFGGLIPNAPLVQGNGTSLYGCQEGKTLFKLPLSQQYKQECIRFARDNPWVWLVAGNEHTVMQVDFGDSRDTVTKALTDIRIDAEEFLRGEYLKLVYVVETEERIPELQRITDGFSSAGSMGKTLSSPVFLETYDKRASKASGIRLAMELAGLEGKTLVCIGDYYNDEAMLRIADIPACPANAPEDIKALCSIVTCGNNEGALADLIETLEQM